MEGLPEDVQPPPLSKTESSSSMMQAARRATDQFKKVTSGVFHYSSASVNYVGSTVGSTVSLASSVGTKAAKAPYNIMKADAVAKLLCTTLHLNCSKAELNETDIDAEQLAWETFSKWLQQHKLRTLALPVDLPIDSSTPPCAPAWGMSENSVLKRVSVVKRFNSRKQPHLIEMENTDGKTLQMIYKQDDDISMDVAVMKLFEMCNEVWKRRNMPGFMVTYKIVACPDLTGFGEIVPGATMLATKTDDMVNQLGSNKEMWHHLFHTLIGVMVTTAIFDITDRHHNNVLFTPSGELALIDLSASLGKVAPMDKALRINPIYIPERIKSLRNEYNQKLETFGYEPDVDMRRWQDLEEAAITHYYAIYNDRAIEHVLQAANYRMLKPHKFLVLLHERKSGRQVSEGVRNNIVTAMDESDAINAFVAGISRVVPMN